MSLACTPPSDAGRELVRWSAREVAIQAVRAGVVETIHYSTVYLILEEFELKPHLTSYWLHSQDPQFEEKAASVLWYYERAASLLEEGVVVLCLDEKTGIQALGRKFPDVPMEPGMARLREFEYIRHGVVNLQMSLEVATGEIWGRSIPKNDQRNMIHTLEELNAKYESAKRIELIWDNGSSHTGRETRAWLEAHRDRIRPHFTPTHASWLNQAEIALGSFSRRYLKGRVVESKEQLLEHLQRGLVEYNTLYAGPINWTFNRRKLHDWYARHKLPQDLFN